MLFGGPHCILVSTLKRKYDGGTFFVVVVVVAIFLGKTALQLTGDPLVASFLRKHVQVPGTIVLSYH